MSNTAQKAGDTVHDMKNAVEDAVHLEVGPKLISGLDNADAGTRAASARALGLSHDRSLLPFLLQHLHDPDLLAGDRVAQAIGRLGEPAAVALLMPALSDTDEVIRARAATALGLLHAAVELNLSENTVEGYVKEILGKRGVRNRVEAISSARENGLL